MSRVRLEPALAVAAVVSALACLLIPGGPFVRLPFAVAAVMILPGAAVTLALFPDARRDPARMAALGVGLSLTLGVFLTVELGAFQGLTDRLVAAATTGTTLVACAVAWRRAARRTPRARVAGRRRGPWRRIGIVSMVAAGMALLGIAVAVARTPLPVPDDRGYTELSIARAATSASSVIVHVASDEAGTRRFRLVVRVPGKPVRVFPTTLAPGATADIRVSLRGSRPGDMEARLVDEAAPTSIYRRVRIRLPLQGPAPVIGGQARR